MVLLVARQPRRRTTRRRRPDRGRRRPPARPAAAGAPRLGVALGRPEDRAPDPRRAGRRDPRPRRAGRPGRRGRPRRRPRGLAVPPAHPRPGDGADHRGLPARRLGGAALRAVHRQRGHRRRQRCAGQVAAQAGELQPVARAPDHAVLADGRPRLRGRRRRADGRRAPAGRRGAGAQLEGAVAARHRAAAGALHAPRRRRRLGAPGDPGDRRPGGRGQLVLPHRRRRDRDEHGLRAAARRAEPGVRAARPRPGADLRRRPARSDGHAPGPQPLQGPARRRAAAARHRRGLPAHARARRDLRRTPTRPLGPPAGPRAGPGRGR